MASHLGLHCFLNTCITYERVIGRIKIKSQRLLIYYQSQWQDWKSIIFSALISQPYYLHLYFWSILMMLMKSSQYVCPLICHIEVWMENCRKSYLQNFTREAKNCISCYYLVFLKFYNTNRHKISLSYNCKIWCVGKKVYLRWYQRIFDLRQFYSWN